MAQNFTYTQCGDYYIPDIKLSYTSTQALGKYGRMRRAFLEQNKPMLFNDMILTESLFPHLREVQQTCEKRMELLMMELLMTDLLEKNPAPDKATQQLVWVAHMNSLKAQAEESVLRELVYEEDIV
ncbi:MAG TPA: TnpV protein [Ruminococcaceae bacterium]|nr:TnpV protein [Oscillospiraceae bacterium]